MRGFDSYIRHQAHQKKVDNYVNPLYNIIKSFLLYNDIYNSYNKYINLNYIKDSYKDIYKIIKTLFIYKTDHVNNTVSEFSLFFFGQYPAMRVEEVELYISIFQRIEDTVVSEGAILEYLEAYKTKEVATKVALKAIEVSEGRASFPAIVELCQDINFNLEIEPEDVFVTSDLKEIYETTLHRPGLRWRLNTLNKMLGSLRQGDFGFVFARPEVGKTTFLASETTCMAEQLELAKEDGGILWVNNEQAGKVVMSRCYQAALGLSTEQLYSDFPHNSLEFIRRTGDRIKILDDANANRKQIDLLCKRIKPKLIVIDQIDKIKGFENDRYDLKMKDIYQWARELSKVYGPTIGTCQAGGTGEGKKWLQMNDVDSSHTAKQGEADFVLGIGKVFDDNYESERYLCLAKNKLPGDKDTIAALRHGKCPVKILPEIARYEDKLRWDK